MKANAPEKIYVDANENWLKIYTAFTEKAKGNDIEYTRTDAFIEKACDFFEGNIEEEDCKIGSSEWTELKAEYKSLDSFIRAFENYMKGE